MNLPKRSAPCGDREGKCWLAPSVHLPIMCLQVYHLFIASGVMPYLPDHVLVLKFMISGLCRITKPPDSRNWLTKTCYSPYRACHMTGINMGCRSHDKNRSIYCPDVSSSRSENSPPNYIYPALYPASKKKIYFQLNCDLTGNILRPTKN